MSGHSAELDGFLGTVAKLLDRHTSDEGSAGRADPHDLRAGLDSAGVTKLGYETNDIQDATAWLANTVRTVSSRSPSVAFALTSRFVGQRVLYQATRSDDIEDVAAGLLFPAYPSGTATDGLHAILPRLLPSTTQVLIDVSADRECRKTELDLAACPAADTMGLHPAMLADVVLPEANAVSLTGADARAALQDYSLMIGAAAAGIVDAAVLVAERYAVERRQFGSPIAGFAGLRAIIAEMVMRRSELDARLTYALETGGLAESLELAANAARAAVDVSLAGIQVLGGYGYMDEFPVTRLVRDAIGLQARSPSRRAALALVAAPRVKSK